MNKSEELLRVSVKVIGKTEKEAWKGEPHPESEYTISISVLGPDLIVTREVFDKVEVGKRYTIDLIELPSKERKNE